MVGMNEVISDALSLIAAWCPSAPIGTVMDFIESVQDDFDDGEEIANAYVEAYPTHRM